MEVARDTLSFAVSRAYEKRQTIRAGSAERKCRIRVRCATNLPLGKRLPGATPPFQKPRALNRLHYSCLGIFRAVHAELPEIALVNIDVYLIDPTLAKTVRIVRPFSTLSTSFGGCRSVNE